MALKSFAPHTLNGQPRRANASVTVILFVNIPRLGAPAVPQGPPQQLFATFPSTRCASVRRPVLVRRQLVRRPCARASRCFSRLWRGKLCVCVTGPPVCLFLRRGISLVPVCAPPPARHVHDHQVHHPEARFTHILCSSASSTHGSALWHGD